MKVDALILKIPLAGNLVIQLSVAQVTRSLATLLAGGITLVESWEIAAESITNRELRRRSSEILPMIREGRSFTESLEVAGWLPLLAIDMVGIGERSGSLREMLDEIAVFYDAESEVRLEQLTTTLEPAILVVMGGVVVTILLAIYLPIISSISGGTGSRAATTDPLPHRGQQTGTKLNETVNGKSDIDSSLAKGVGLARRKWSETFSRRR